MVQTITYQRQRSFGPETVKVRESRTMSQTKAQYLRIARSLLADGHAMNRLQEVYERTYRALHATRRSDGTLCSPLRLMKIN